LHPVEVNVTVNVYIVLADKSVKVAVVPKPVCIAPPGVAVKVHAAGGKPFSAILPVTRAHVGCVMVPIVGAVSGAG
jgi:hypothetical protein